MIATPNSEMSEVSQWLQSARWARSSIGSMFVRLNGVLGAADSPEVWLPATRLMHQFIDRLEIILNSDNTEANWSRSDSSRLLSILLTIIAESGQYRHEQYKPVTEDGRTRRTQLDEELLPAMGELRRRAIALAKIYLARPVFGTLHAYIEHEIYPLLDSMDPGIAPDRYMPFRVIQIGNVAERLYGFRVRTNDGYLVGNDHEWGLLQSIYNRKYLRFGTSGVRGRWGIDFTESRAQQVVQAICDFLHGDHVPRHVGAENLSGRRIVIGYDSRRHASEVAVWVAQVCVANGFRVDLASRDTPTPALVYYLTDYLEENDVAGLINCTASHNPPEWQGIKFNPRLGYPAPTSVTDFIASHINELQLQDLQAFDSNLSVAQQNHTIISFDPISHYSQWILNNGKGNQRLPIDIERIRTYFHNRLVVVDEMHGAGRGYLTKLLGEIGIRHTVIHAERDLDLTGLQYANPEEPFIDPLKKQVQELSADIGLALDTDADRFGIVDRKGRYFRPNQILTMLVRYLGIDRGFTGRVIATQTGSPLIDILAAKITGNDDNKPQAGVVPAYVDHPFYHLRVGRREQRMHQHTFLVPVGIKYIEEQRRTDRSYHLLNPLPQNWRDTILIGGEESSGLTSRGHVTDKDGIWADLLVLDMWRRSSVYFSSIITDWHRRGQAD